MYSSDGHQHNAQARPKMAVCAGLARVRAHMQTCCSTCPDVSRHTGKHTIAAADNNIGHGLGHVTLLTDVRYYRRGVFNGLHKLTPPIPLLLTIGSSACMHAIHTQSQPSGSAILQSAHAMLASARKNAKLHTSSQCAGAVQCCRCTQSSDNTASSHLCD